MHDGIRASAVWRLREEMGEELAHVEVRRHCEMEGGEDERRWLLDDAIHRVRQQHWSLKGAYKEHT